MNKTEGRNVKEHDWRELGEGTEETKERALKELDWNWLKYMKNND